MNCCVRPSVIEGVAGVTVMDVRTAAVTVRDAVPVIAPEVAVIVEVPTATPVARPPLLMVAVAVELEVQVTAEVMSAVEPSE